MPKRAASKPPTPLEPDSPKQLVQDYVDSLLQEGANELGIKAPGDIARVLDHLDAIVTDFSMRGESIDDETMRWIKRSAKTALGSAKVRNLGRLTRAQAGAVSVASGAAKLALAAMLAQISAGVTLNRFAPP